MKRYLFFTLFLCFLFLMNWIVKAQETTEPPTINPKDVESVDNIISAFYQSISGTQEEKRDWNRFQSLFFPNARLIPTGKANEQGQFRTQLISVADFIISSDIWFTENGYFQKEIFRKTDSFSHLTHVISTFESRKTQEENFFIRGVYSIQLFHDGDRWWIINVYWTTETEEHLIPEEYLPQSN